MREIKSKWNEVAKYGDEEEFKFWSSKVKGEGDKDLESKRPLEKWTKVIILKPKGNPDTAFSMGFSSVFGQTKISNAVRKIKEGPFGMRIGFEDCEFFIVSNQGEVELELERYGHRYEPGIDLY